MTQVKKRVKPLFQRKKKRNRGHLEHSQWNLSAHLRKVSPKSLGNLCAPLQLHSQAVLGVTVRRGRAATIVQQNGVRHGPQHLRSAAHSAHSVYSAFRSSWEVPT